MKPETRRGARALALACACLGACAPAPPAEAPGLAPRHPLLGELARDASPRTPPARVTPLGPEASAITFQRMARHPEPGWHAPRSMAFAPGGEVVTFLQSEALDGELGLFAFDLGTRATRLVARAKDVVAAARPESREEELRRERQRQRATGIGAYAWAEKADVLLLPVGGDVFVRRGAGGFDRLTDTPDPEIDPKICASGARVAFARGREIAVVDVATKRETWLTRGAPEGVTRGQSDFQGQEELDEPSGLFWSPGCDRLAYLEVDEREVGEVPVLGRRGGKQDLMLQRYPLPGGTNPTVRLGVVDLATKRTTWIARPAGGEYVARVRFSPDGRALYFQAIARDQRRIALVRADVTSGACHELAVEGAATWVEPTDVRPLADGERVLWITQAGGRRHLEVRAAKGGALAAKVTAGDWDVDDLVGVDEERGLALFTATKDGPLERHLYRAPLDGRGPVERLTAEPGVHAPVVDRRGRAIVDVHSARTRLPKAVVRTVAGEVLGELPTPVDPDLAELGIRPPELVTVPGAAGLPLHAAVLAPRRIEPGRRHPAIVMVYGGPGVQTVLDRWQPRLLWQHLADRGFFVMQVDGRGSAGRGHAFEATLHGRLGTVELEDQLAARDWLAAQPFVDGARVGVHGASYGGFLTALAMLKAPGRFRAGVAAAPVTDFRLYDAAYTERYLGRPGENPAGYDATDLARLAPALAGRLLLLHGQLDENVHVENTSRLVDALVEAGKPFDELVFPGERHGFRSPAARRYAFERIVGYFVEHL